MCEELEGKVRRIVAEVLGVDESDVVEGASFEGNLGADSLMQIELVMAFEEEFGIEIPDEESERIQTFDEALACLKEHVAAASAAAR